MFSKRHPPFSVIIPTLWRPSTFLQLLQLLEANEDVGEIIIIDNARTHRPYLPKMTKIRLIDKGENLFVNPSWNLGIQLAKSNSICICNDDVIMSDALFGYMRTRSLRRVTGLHPQSYSMAPTAFCQHSMEEGADIPHNWGSIIFLDKRNYRPIPNSLKIWWGDAWLAQEMGPASSVRTAVYTKHSVSAGSPEFKAITQQDTHIWLQTLKSPPSLIRRAHARIIRFLRKLGI